MRTSSSIFSASVFVAALVAFAPASARRAPLLPEVSANLASVALPSSVQNDPSILRARYTTIDFDMLREPSRGRLPQIARTVPLDLFPDVSVEATFERFDPNPSGVTWVGRVDDVPFSHVTLVYGGGVMTGSISLRDRHFLIRPAPAEVQPPGIFARPLHLVTEVDQHALPPEAPPIEVEIPAAEQAAADARPLADSGDTIDLMVVYTQQAMTWAGGQQGIANLIDVAVSQTNTSFISSDVATRVRLVHSQLVPYTETNAFGRNLDDLRVGAGGLNSVAALRDQHRADVVTMLVRPAATPDACGVGYLLTVPTTAFAPLAFNVTDTTCIPGYTFAHELGHNMGLRHDWFVDSGITPFTYAHGYVNPAPGQRWRTIMSYNDLCGSQGFNCTRVLRWANPDDRFNPLCFGGGFSCLPQFWFVAGVPTGVPEGTKTDCAPGSTESYLCDAHDSRALNETAPFVANFRAAATPNARRR